MNYVLCRANEDFARQCGKQCRLESCYGVGLHPSCTYRLDYTALQPRWRSFVEIILPFSGMPSSSE